MTHLLADIKPWEGHVVPGVVDPRFRMGAVVSPKGKGIHDVQAPTQKMDAKPGLGDGQLIKQLVNVLQKQNITSKMHEAIPEYRSL